jgi:hypothetical protein
VEISAWDRFVQSIDPVKLRREHVRVHGDITDELFSSSAHHRMMVEHERHVADLHRPREGNTP